MAGGNIGIRLTVDASQAKEQVESYSESLSKMNEKLMEAQESGDWSSAAKMTMAIDNLTSAQKQQMAMANLVHRGQGGGQGGGVQVGSNIVAGANTASNAVSTLATGNYAGAAINATKRAGSSLRNIGKDMGGTEGMGGLAALLGGAGVALLAGGAAAAGGNALANKYEEALPYMADFNKLFRGIGTDTTSQEMYWYNRATDAAEGTNLSNIEMMEAARNEARYGMKKGDNEMQTGNEIIEEARKAALMSYATGADMAMIQNFQGTMRRYTGDTDALSTSHAALIATGMQEAQYEEFLNSLQKAVEEGIESGYTKSIEEVSANLTMFARLSGENPLWQGEQGVKRLMQVESRLSGATALQSTSDVMLATATKNALDSIGDDDEAYERLTGVKRGDWSGSYIDTMLALEKGLSPEATEQMFKIVQDMEGDNVQGQIEQYMDLTGLNYKGAVEIYKMSKQAENEDMSFDEISKKINAFKEDKEYLNNETKMQHTLNELSRSLVGFGKEAFDIKISGLGKVEDITEKIYQYLIGKDKPIFDGLFDEKEGKGFLEKSYQDELTSAWKKNPAILEGFNVWYNDLSEEEKTKINESNIFNTRDLQKFMNTWQGIKDAGGIDRYLEDTRISSGISTEEQRIFRSVLDDEESKRERANVAKITMLRGFLYEDGEQQDAIDRSMIDKLKRMFSSGEKYEAFLRSDDFSSLARNYYDVFAEKNIEGRKDPSVLESNYESIIEYFVNRYTQSLDSSFSNAMSGLWGNISNFFTNGSINATITGD